MDAQAKEIKNKVMCEINSFAIVYLKLLTIENTILIFHFYK
jgi:hypothetical protein